MSDDLFTRAGMDAQPYSLTLPDRDADERHRMEYASQMLLRGMIRELESMGRLG